ncbi:hypothetical protein Tco_0933240 [Tanacetum coccineum]
MLCLFIGAGCYIAAIKHMASNFAKLDKFEGVDFRRWQKKMHFLLFSMSVVYVLTDPILEDGGDDATVEQIRKRAKWDNDDYVCRGLILNGMSDSLFDIYQNVEYYKELWDSLQEKYMAKDGSSKKFLVSNFANYKMIDSRPVMEQYNELLGILGRFTQHKMNMDEAIQVSCIIDQMFTQIPQKYECVGDVVDFRTWPDPRRDQSQFYSCDAYSRIVLLENRTSRNMGRLSEMCVECALHR